MENFYLCNSVALQTDLSKSAFKIYSFLAKSADSKTHSSFYKRSNIARFCHTSESTVIRAIRELCTKGLLEVKRRFLEKGQQTSNLYILLDNQQLKIGATASNGDLKDKEPLVCVEPNKEPSEDAQGKLRLFRCYSASFNAILSPNELKVYSYLSFRAGKNAQCLPSKRDISSDCRISVSTVSRAIKRLRQVNLLEVHSQDRLETFGNNGTSVNLYVLKELPNKSDERASVDLKPAGFKGIFIACLVAFLSSLTPSPMSPVTPHRTISRMKVTLKQRKEDLISKLAKSILAHIYSKPAGKHKCLANSSHDTG